jgi:hypothetical protein
MEAPGCLACIYVGPIYTVKKEAPVKEGGTALRRLGRTCIECNSGIIGKVEEKELRQFRFEKIEFACGATLESFHTANGNVSRAIHSGCTVDE